MANNDQQDNTGKAWSESARQVWLAGMGAWTRAQAEGSKLFDGLVRDGLEAERESTRAAGVRDTVGRGAEDVRGFATGTWERMGQFVEDTVQRTLLRLGVPTREDMDALRRRIDMLESELRAAKAAPKAPRKTAPTTGEGAATRKPPA